MLRMIALASFIFPNPRLYDEVLFLSAWPSASNHFSLMRIRKLTVTLSGAGPVPIREEAATLLSGSTATIPCDFPPAT
jgi:hypothetical protein